MFFSFRPLKLFCSSSVQVHLSNKICMNIKLNVNNIKTIKFFFFFFMASRFKVKVISTVFYGEKSISERSSEKILLIFVLDWWLFASW